MLLPAFAMRGFDTRVKFDDGVVVGANGCDAFFQRLADAEAGS